LFDDEMEVYNSDEEETERITEKAG